MNSPAAPAFGLENPDLFGWLGLVVFVALEVRGAHVLRRRRAELFPRWRMVCFCAALVALGLALYSPLDGLGAFLLVAHMAQHLLLAMVVPPLLLLGAPPAVMLRGMPRPVVRHVVAPLLADRRLRALGTVLGHPVTATVVLIASSWIWHVPALYQRALADPAWHAAEHASFLAAGLLFWWPVVEPPPFRARWPRWAMIPYLLIADLQNTALAALLVFRERVLYPHYARVPRFWGIDALADQSRAGALMWVVGSVVFLVPVAVIVGRLLSPAAAFGRSVGAPLAARGGWPAGVGGRVPATGGLAGMSAVRAAVPGGSRIGTAVGIDILAWPRLGRVVAALSTRRVAQLLLCVLAAAVVLDGMGGPERSTENLAGILPWTWWRALLFAVLLAVGNLFCGVCPFMLPRDLARRWVRPSRRWPLALRRKWIAAALLLCGFVAYEVFDLWDDPRATALVVLAYFAAALVVDVLFAGASFCKWLCPIGQMNFVTSTLSPLEVAVRDPAVCTTCTSRDCLRGGPGGRGCELDLYLPTKRGNLDCTFCLDCVRACPVENVGLGLRTPVSELAWAGARASIGRLRHRRDLAAVMGLFVFGALINAAGMSAPVVRGEVWLGARAGLAAAPGVITAVWMLVALGALAPASVLAAAALGRRLAHLRVDVGVLAAALVPALVPLGCAIWFVHFAAHFASGWATLVPATARVLGRAVPACLAGLAGGPAAHVSAAGEGSGTLLVLGAGLVTSCALAGRIARGLAETAEAERGVTANPRRTAVADEAALAPAARLALPWFGLAVLIFAAAAGVLLAPMEMRGTAAGLRP